MKKFAFLISLTTTLMLFTGVSPWLADKKPMCFIMKSWTKMHRYLSRSGNLEFSQLYGTWYTLGMSHSRWKGCTCQIHKFWPTRQMEGEKRPKKVGSFDGYMGCDMENQPLRVVAYSKNSYNTKFRMAYQMSHGTIKRWVKFDYWIVDTSPDMSWMIVSEPCRTKAFILARTPKIDPDLYADLVLLVGVELKVKMEDWRTLCQGEETVQDENEKDYEGIDSKENND